MAEETPSEEPRHRPDGRDVVAAILAVGVTVGLVCFTFAVLYDALFSEHAGLSTNATQILSGGFGGIVGALAVYLGGRRDRQPPS